MALIIPTKQSFAPKAWGSSIDIFGWLGATSGSTFQGISPLGWCDASFQVEGTFAGALVSAQGCIDGVNFHTLHDPFANPISFSVASFAQIVEICPFIIPVMQGAAGGTSLNIYLCVRNPLPQ